MSAYRIEKGVPVGGRCVRASYPFPDMAVGDSFFVPASPESVGVVRARLASAAGRYHERHGEFAFSTALVEGGVRCWRVEVAS